MLRVITLFHNFQFHHMSGHRNYGTFLFFLIRFQWDLKGPEFRTWSGPGPKCQKWSRKGPELATRSGFFEMPLV